MEVKIDKNRNLKITHHLLKNENYKIQTGKFNSVNIYKKPQLLKGMASYCEDGKHVLFIDFDNIPRWLVEQDYKKLQEEYKLPRAYLFTTKEKKWNGDMVGNYHLVCLKKFYPKEIYKIISKTHADVNFMSMPLRRVYRNWVLRISTKKRRDRPKFIDLIGEQINNNCEISSAHYNFLKKIYPKINHSAWENQDKLNKIFLQEYEAT